jgi:hypothetical protein
MDQEGEIVAEGAHNWADVIFRQQDGDLIKAEGLARESIRIKDQLYGAHGSRVSGSFLHLARILLKQGKLGDETKELFEHSLANFSRDEGPDGGNTASANIKIGQFYYEIAMISSTGHAKRAQLLLAKSYFDEAM